ncbi:MAG: AraC family transcriptional regulator, partial [Anaerovorax sp.]
ESMENLRIILSRIMMEMIEKGNNFESKIIESTHNLIGILMAEFQYFSMEGGKFVNETKNKGNKILAGRLNRITDYLYENYARRLTLNEVAEKEHLSIFYLSHVIKTATGLSFQELLSFIRVEESEKLLLGSNKKIGAISDETGFSAVRYYIKYFTKWFGMPPAEYREKFTGKVISREILAKYTLSTPDEIMDIIKERNREVYGDFTRDQEPQISIIDLDLTEKAKSLLVKDCQLKTLLKSENMKPANLAFKMFKDLNEDLIFMTDQCLISQEFSKVGQGQKGISILVVNTCEEVQQMADDKISMEETMERLKTLDNKIEVLIRISGIGGGCRISRYKLFKENIIMGYGAKLGLSTLKDKRDLMLDRWGSNPQVTSTNMSSTDNISIQSNLEGFSMELILIDTIFD